MDQVEVVERHIEHPNQRVVACSHQDQGDEVDDGKASSPVPQNTQHLSQWLVISYANDTERHIHANHAAKEDELKPCRKSTHIQGGRQPELLVMTLTEHRRVKNVLLGEGIHRIGQNEVLLHRIVETGKSAYV